MKILHVIPYMHPSAGGPPVVADRWCRWLAENGHHSEVLTTTAYSEEEASEEWAETFRQHYPVTLLPLRGPRGFGFAKDFPRALRQRLSEVDLVHVHNLWNYPLQVASRVCPRMNVPFVVSTHGMLDPNSVSRKRWKKAAYGKWLEFPALRKSAGVFCTHVNEATLANQTCSGLAEKLVVPLGTDDPPDVSRQELAVSFFARHSDLSGKQIVLFLGRVHSKKGLDLLIPAFASLVEELPDARLVLAGPGDPSDLEHFRQLCNAHQIADRVIFTGILHGREKWQAIAAASVFALPSYQENFAIALVEAIRMGVPAVISDRINIWQDLVDSGGARQAELSVKSVKENLYWFLSHPTEAESEGMAGAEYCAKHFTWQKSGECLAEAYGGILSK